MQPKYFKDLNKRSKVNQVKRLLRYLINWHKETIYFCADDFFNALIADLEKAQKSIQIECYIFELDDLGLRIVDKIKDASKRGVNVSVFIDGVGSSSWTSDNIDELVNHNIAIKVFHPLPWRLSRYKDLNNVQGFLNKMRYLLSTANKRNHRKLYIIDEKLAFSGSINITCSHLSLRAGGENWFDCGVRLEGDVVPALSDNFKEIWRQKGRFRLAKKRLPFRSNRNAFSRQHKNYEFIHLIRSSVQRVWIISAYLAPSKRVLRALKKARQQGSDVRLIVSQRSDVNIFPLISRVYYEELLASGVEIFEFNNQIIHAKTTLVDEIAMVGSSNLNHRSFLHDLELDILLTHPESLAQLEKQFLELQSNSKKIVHSALAHQAWHHRLLAKLLWRLRYWL